MSALNKFPFANFAVLSSFILRSVVIYCSLLYNFLSLFEFSTSALSVGSLMVDPSKEI